MFIDGEVEARNKQLDSNLRRQSTSVILSEMQDMNESERGYIKTFAAGTSHGEQCFEQEFVHPFNLVCTQRCLSLSLSKKDFAEVLYY